MPMARRPNCMLIAAVRLRVMRLKVSIVLAIGIV